MFLRFLLLPVALIFLTIVAQPPMIVQPKGVLPLGAGGKPLNLDFETGDLRDWTLEGEAFKGQPIKGDVVRKRRADMQSNHQGEYWIGGFERHKDLPQGTMTSAAFKVTHRWAAFLVGGGPHQTTCVELVTKADGKVFHRSSGQETEAMRYVVVDLQEQKGKEIFIRLVDQHGGHWGHVNFDDFKFYETKPNFPLTPTPLPQGERGRGEGPKRIVDLFANAGLTPEKAAEVMTVPEGFKVTAFAGEPDVRQPIAMTIDDRGRLWVAECYAYPAKVRKEDAKDRILIFEDTNGDGKFDKRTIFYEGLNLVSGIEVGFGGVWVGQAPELLFIPDKDGDDKPDGPPRVILDGWGMQDTHETLNSFIWGPDGWLYGCHGVFTHSNVGKPGTTANQRTRLNAGIWRYHPIKETFEVFAHGTSNPWGVDFNDKGDCFLTCCVIPHLFHMVQGGRYHRQGGVHFNPHTYADIPTIANHRHWVGNQWNDADRAKSDGNGGGHAHAGAMIYLGDTWPKKYRGQLFMNNIHGARLNVDRLTPRGSGYVGDGEPDFLKANDLWSQILYLRYGPDGNVYMIDWYDRNQCHHGNAALHDRSNGRIFKIEYAASRERKRPEVVDLAKKSDQELVELQLHKNDWYVRQARRLLMERAAVKKLDLKVRETLEKMAFEHEDASRRLRGLWALHVTGGLSAKQCEKGLLHEDEQVRRWTIQLGFEERGKALPMNSLSQLALNEKSPVVRLALASALPRMSDKDRWGIASSLLLHAEDAADHNLPLLYWYGVEPLVELDARRALRLVATCRIPLVRSFLIRRLGANGEGAMIEMLVGELASAKETETRLLFLSGIQQAMVGRLQSVAPKSWQSTYETLKKDENGEVRRRALALAVAFNDPAAFEIQRAMVANTKTPLEERREGLAVLVAARDKELLPVLQQLLKEEGLRGDALRGLALFDDPKTPELLLSLYPSLSAAEKRDALSTLTSRIGFARTLLDAVGAKKVASTDLTADLVRQLRSLKDEAINKQIEKVWGIVRESPEEKAKQIVYYKRLITSVSAKEADLPLGRAVFAKICAQCHTLFDDGGKVGPELTGSNRRDLDYVLSNVLDPSAVLAKEYIPSVVETKAGRFIVGLIREETKNAVTVVTAQEKVIVPRAEIESMTLGDKSMMPDDLLKALTEREVRALIAYLAIPRQVPLPPKTEDGK